MIIPHDDIRIAWRGAVSLERTESYTRPWRLPWSEIDLFPPTVVERAICPAGVRLVFKSSTRKLSGRILLNQENRKLDLCIDGKLIDSVDLTGREDFLLEGLPPGEKVLELWLPQNGPFALTQVEVDEDATFESVPDDRPKWVTYGSSITQCGAAASPSRTWPAIVARQRNLNLTCLGYSGNCHLEVQIARMMRELPADYISICAGINIYGAGSLNARTFAPALIGFVQILREKHPTTPILLISPISSKTRNFTKNAVGMTLDDYRTAVRDVVAKLQDHGDANIRYLNGLNLMNEEHHHMMPDDLHPNASGYEQLAQNFLTHAPPLLFEV